jgi:hypothetical protein
MLRIPAKMNADSGDGERRFRASRTLIGAKRRQQWVSGSSSQVGHDPQAAAHQ